MVSTPHIHDKLVQACKRNDRSAQEELYRLYSGAMYNVSYRILQSREEAEDVLQESFLDAFTSIQTFRGEASFGSWLKRIVVNRSINETKKRKVHFGELKSDVAEEPEESQHDLPDCTIDDVKKAMEKLPDGFRIVFSLYMFEDWSHRDIAEKLGITESTSKSQLNRAKKKMAELIVEQTNNGYGKG